MQHPALLELIRKDPRYPYEAYLFVFEALEHTQRRLGRGVALDGHNATQPERHVSGPELLEGACELAREQFGLMARVVFHLWNIHRTDDFGELVFNLIDAEVLSKTEQDHRDDFHDLFELDKVLTEGYSIAAYDVPRQSQDRR